MGTLTGKVAVVAGATRGAGRGIARGLGEAGATVYCTGRSTKGQPSPYQRPETIEETAEMVTAIGGTGIAVKVDHGQEAEVEALFQRVEAEQGRLDLLVNSIAGEDPLLGGWTSLWETDLGQGAEALRNTILTHVITAKHAARLMMKQGRGLIVEVTEHDLLGGGGNVLGDLAKASKPINGVTPRGLDGPGSRAGHGPGLVWGWIAAPFRTPIQSRTAGAHHETHPDRRHRADRAGRTARRAGPGERTGPVLLSGPAEGGVPRLHDY